MLATDVNKKAETDTTAERTIVFVASDNSEDRAHERVEIATFYLPTKNGGLVRVADLPKRTRQQEKTAACGRLPSDAGRE